MKTTFTSDDDKEWLDKIIHRAIMQTESTTYNTLMHKMREVKDYTLFQFEIRKKCFEFLGEEDPNEKINQHLIADLESTLNSKDKVE